ncbi:MAG TPA: hypothetical protein PLU30_12645 [Verrucomicrobiae bacterium]|nr:hypothetical protein [Verrucomicrobiae bacterium]
MPTVERAFQGAKILYDKNLEEIRAAATPGEAKRMGRRFGKRLDWDEVNNLARSATVRHFHHR